MCFPGILNSQSAKPFRPSGTRRLMSSHRKKEMPTAWVHNSAQKKAHNEAKYLETGAIGNQNRIKPVMVYFSTKETTKLLVQNKFSIREDHKENLMQTFSFRRMTDTSTHLYLFGFRTS